MADGEEHVGSIEHTRKLLSFLKELDAPSPTAKQLIRQYEAEVAGYEYAQRWRAREEEADANDFHDVAGARV